MQELQWMLDLDDSTNVLLREDVAEKLGVSRSCKLGDIRELIQPEPKQAETLIETESDLNREL